ncbi:hypothetical protein X758_28030 [Mesorhizobium sp. LSHC416B00]|nr:hypothetical protein X758_28030 [Mesorhizobium sp. LSHC416B00]
MISRSLRDDSRIKIGCKLARSSLGWVTLAPSNDAAAPPNAPITFWSFQRMSMVPPQYGRKLMMVSLVAASPTRRNNAMTLSTPILASALVLAVAALLAMRSAAAAAAARMVKVRVDRRRPAPR